MADDRRQQLADDVATLVQQLYGFSRQLGESMADALLPLLDRVAVDAAAEAWDDGYRSAELDALEQPYSDMPEAATWQPRANPHRARAAELRAPARTDEEN